MSNIDVNFYFEVNFTDEAFLREPGLDSVGMSGAACRCRAHGRQDARRSDAGVSVQREPAWRRLGSNEGKKNRGEKARDKRSLRFTVDAAPVAILWLMMMAMAMVCCVRGCVDAWVRGCVGAWVRGCTRAIARAAGGGLRRRSPSRPACR